MVRLLGSRRKADVTVYVSGRIDITSRTGKALGLEDGDVIDVLKADDGEYYLVVWWKSDDVSGRHEGVVMGTNRRCLRHHNFRCYSKRLAGALRSACGVTDDGALKLMTGDETDIDGRRCVCLITKHRL